MNLQKEIENEIRSYAKADKIKILQSFFKTGKGEYGEGDVFIGVAVPDQRRIAKKYMEVELKVVQNLLKSKTHEFRLTALLVLLYKYEKGDNVCKKSAQDFYIENRRFINNWDLVDLSAPKIFGAYMLEFGLDKELLNELISSDVLWDRRIAVLAMYPFIKAGSFEQFLHISKKLLNDEHDLIHKAVGWMLREMGKRDEKVLHEFLQEFCTRMPRTMLRYSLEKLSKEEKRRYMGRQ